MIDYIVSLKQFEVECQRVQVERTAKKVCEDDELRRKSAKMKELRRKSAKMKELRRKSAKKSGKMKELRRKSSKMKRQLQKARLEVLRVGARVGLSRVF